MTEERAMAVYLSPLALSMLPSHQCVMMVIAAVMAEQIENQTDGVRRVPLMHD
jgi:hypothetical protein